MRPQPPFVQQDRPGVLIEPPPQVLRHPTFDARELHVRAAKLKVAAARKIIEGAYIDTVHAGHYTMRHLAEALDQLEEAAACLQRDMDEPYLLSRESSESTEFWL